MSNLVRLKARSFEDLDLYTAVMQDMEWMLKNNGRRVPPNVSGILGQQKRLNDYLRYVMVDFIQKNFNITVPDGMPVGVSPSTVQNGSMIELSSSAQNVARNPIEPKFVSSVYVSGAVTVNVSAVTTGNNVPVDFVMETERIRYPGFTIPQVQEISVSGGQASIGRVHPATRIEPIEFDLPKITCDTQSLGDAVLTLSVLEDGKPVFEQSHKAGIGTETFSFLYALPARVPGSHVYVLQAALNNGSGSIPVGGGKLQVWAQAETTAEG